MVLTKWTPNMTSKFISLYREQECLWRNDSVEYRDKRARHAALKSIILKMKIPGLTMDDVKKKIKHLRSTYMTEVNKMEKSRRAGNVYKPCLSWFEEMHSFIKYVHIKGRNNLIGQTDSEHYDEDTCAENEEIQIIEVLPNKEELDAEEQPGSSTKRVRSPVEPGESTSTGAKESRMRQLMAVVKNMKSIAHNLKEEGPDEFEVFGKHVGIQLKSLLEEDAIVAQGEIQEILTRYRLKKIRSSNEIVCTPTVGSYDNHS